MKKPIHTPICDFVARYGEEGFSRFHMPGHKGRILLGPEGLDITEIHGADELYRSRGIIRESEENAAALFGAARTLYSAEGSSLCIRAMLTLAVYRAAERGIPRRILAGRNAHRTLMTAAALLDLEIDWIPGAPGEGLLQCTPDPDFIRRKLEEKPYMAVWITSPDYPGHLAEVDRIAPVCRIYGTPLMVDNAHGAYLKFLKPDRHPLTQGADACCDSAHKTLPCLTGAAYLHIGKGAPEDWRERAEDAMGLFGSTSPSWLILQSLDLANADLAGDFSRRLAAAAERLSELKTRLTKQGWTLGGGEPMKLTLAPRGMGYTGTELAERLRERRIECEFADPDWLTLMPSAETGEEDWERLETALKDIPPRSALTGETPDAGEPEAVISIREAMLGPSEEVCVEQAEGRILADAYAGCPPAVPIRVAGERIDRAAVECFRYYGVEKVRVVI